MRCARYDVLAHVESLMGGLCSVTVSLILPAVVFYKIRESDLKPTQKYGLLALMAFGVVAASTILYNNIRTLSS